MILTVTPNPSIDHILFVRDFAMQDLLRAEQEKVSPSGKGIDVSIILHTFGYRTRAIGLNAGKRGKLLTDLLDEIGLPYDFIQAQGETRMATLLTDLATGRQSTIITHSLVAATHHHNQLLNRIISYGASSWGLVLAGSIPPGLPDNIYASLLTVAHQEEMVALLDSSGPGLQAGVQGRPHILKINLRELADLAPDAAQWEQEGVDIAALAGFLQARWQEWATQAVVITLGRRGALAITSEGVYFAPALSVPVVSPAGAGDAVSAGLMMARRDGKPWPEALALGMAAAAAVVQNAGTPDCDPAQVRALLGQVEVQTLAVAR
jgi:1-phosphofructokinase family hexose kinase